MSNLRRFPALLLILVLLPSGAVATPQTYEADLEMVSRIRDEGFERSELPDTLSYMTDVLGARLTVSPGMRRAQRWAIGEMERIGLTNIEIEPFMDYGIAWSNDYVSLHLLEPDYQPMVGYPLSHTPGTDGALQLDAVVVDSRSLAELERWRGRLAGKAVLWTPPAVIDLDRINRGSPSRTNEELRELAMPAPPATPRTRPEPGPDDLDDGERMAFFKSEGVPVLLESRSGWPGAVRGFGRPGTKVDRWARQESLDSLPIVAITPEHYNRMHRIVSRGIDVRVEVEVRNTIGNEVQQAANVLGEIPGTDLADEVVMLGAHFDTWHASPNASDNTSGVAVMLEAARILTALGAQPRRTIRVALWSGEEQGIFGSRAYVNRHFGDPASGTTPAYEKFSAYFNQDYGPGKYRGIYLQGNEAARPMFEAWIAPFRDLGVTTVSIRGVGSTDHVPFDGAGLPGFQFLQDRAGGTGGHTNMDFYDTLPIDDLKHNAVVMAAFVYHAAMADQRVPRKD
ncbi:MAG: M20/M25/M40 family metallo-hydrolase [Acidobacteria bacterium]|nr:M20/M25/M40 family metallo-hydrolase [Acidobacteriota bacterium]